LQTTNLTQTGNPTDGIPAPVEGVKGAADAAAEAASEAGEIARLLEEDPDLRIVPDSSSYFTGASAFYDAWLEAQDLLRKYETLPTVSAEQAPRPSWKTLAQYRMDAIGTSIQASKYTKILNILHRLNRIDPRLQPEDVKLALRRFTREVLQKVDQSKKQFLDDEGRAYAIGRRKESSAQVWLVEGEGGVLVNGKPLSEKFVRIHDRESVIWPLLVTDRLSNYNIWAKVTGGGTTGQAEALTLGVARALMIHEPLLKPVLRRGKSSLCLMIRDKITDIYAISWCHHPRSSYGREKEARKIKGKKDACLGQALKASLSSYSFSRA